MHRATEESLTRALRFLEDGLEIVGENVLIYSALGHIHFQFYNYGIRFEAEELKKAEEYAQKILDLDPNSSRAFTLYGCVRFKEGNLQEVAKLLNKALALDPNDRDALMWIVYTYADSGKTEVANRHLDKLLKLEEAHEHRSIDLSQKRNPQNAQGPERYLFPTSNLLGCIQSLWGATRKSQIVGVDLADSSPCYCSAVFFLASPPTELYSNITVWPKIFGISQVPRESLNTLAP